MISIAFLMRKRDALIDRHYKLLEDGFAFQNKTDNPKAQECLAELIAVEGQLWVIDQRLKQLSAIIRKAA